ncbi:TetR/AcrR family transcriptional regulator, partial [Candidatus Fermentibacteria bacterium]
MQKAKRTQDKILAAAVELLAKNHFANVSMGDIAKACNLTKPTI